MSVALAADPARAMADYFGLTVRESSTLSQRGDGGWCDGMSFRRHNEVLYAPSPFSKRKYFTMLHELGHKLTDDEEDEEILDGLGEIDNEHEVVEQVCDLVAGRLLVPDSTINEVLDGFRPTGEALARSTVLQMPHGRRAQLLSPAASDVQASSPSSETTSSPSLPGWESPGRLRGETCPSPRVIRSDPCEEERFRP